MKGATGEYSSVERSSEVFRIEVAGCSSGSGLLTDDWTWQDVGGMVGKNEQYYQESRRNLGRGGSVSECNQ